MKVHCGAIAAFALCVLASPFAFAQAPKKPCTKAEAAAAEKAIERVVNWPLLQKAVRDFGHCDAGPIDEAYTDALLRLAVAWKDVDAFASAFKDAEFKQFVVRHLQSPEAKDDLESVYSRSTGSWNACTVRSRSATNETPMPWPPPGLTCIIFLRVVHAYPLR